jgi:solute carrier family 50 protein (sugar transporter)
VLGIYYMAPLSSLLQVLRERDSSSIYWPLSLTNLVNAALWFVYGMVRAGSTAADRPSAKQLI